MVKISSFLIGVSDLKKSKPFFENVFGMSFEEFRPPFASAVLDGLEINIEEDAPERPSDWSQTHIGGRKQVSFEVDNLESFLEEAKRNGAKIVQEPEEKPWGWKEAIIADFDSNEFLIEQKM